jgi:predicted pyridoxine 5'-phosphate oxidase superfamily flavin-nucleotide-binding protein
MNIITHDIREFVNRVRLGFVATVCPDGSPNLSPKGTTIAWDNHHLAFADIHSPGTIDNLLTNPSVEVNVVDVFLRKGYRFKGQSIILTEGETYASVLSFYRDAGLQYKINHIVMIKVERIIPVLSPAYDDNSSEEEVKGRWMEYWHSIYPVR